MTPNHLIAQAEGLQLPHTWRYPASLRWGAAIVSAAFVGVGAFLGNDLGAANGGLVVGGIFVFGALLLAVGLLHPSLSASTDGLCITIVRRHRLAWHEIERLSLTAEGLVVRTSTGRVLVSPVISNVENPLAKPVELGEHAIGVLIDAAAAATGAAAGDLVGDEAQETSVLEQRHAQRGRISTWVGVATAAIVVAMWTMFLLRVM